ncbi:hypothetical protein PENTCL1PPCAC_6415 [Pristionchus entomophagus]|uniref:Secreted frizzled-related protein 1 n=1 Tax=Pristionchus entomophagus TaxID=358040 RepID=A0AAV5SVZ1_9BILA|nr:hypothetical protein PENTCL1PPCAC_6415 [Pristionchus entomophagus]
MLPRLWITVATLCVLSTVRARAYLSESWSMIASNDRTQSTSKCVAIPSNLTLCKNIQYTEMQLPNLLEHETLAEVVHHSQDWLSLLNLNCNPHTQLFLCSVFAPVCLPEMAKSILPCRSLCELVQNGCEGRMRQYGFPWPEMLSCSLYPEENDMCIKPPTAEKITAAGATVATPCESCTQVGTYENIIDNFCRSAVVLKARIAEVHGAQIKIRNGRSLKKGDRKRSVGEKTISLSARGACPCELKKNAPSNQRYLIMANKDSNGDLVATLVLPWQKEKNFKRAVHQFSRVNCKLLGREIRASASRRPHSLYALRKHNPPSSALGY